MAYNCLDRHVANGLGDTPCLLWEGNEPGTDRTLTYAQVLQEVCRLVGLPLLARFISLQLCIGQAWLVLVQVPLTAPEDLSAQHL